jgi:hypothetical protein
MNPRPNLQILVVDLEEALAQNKFMTHEAFDHVFAVLSALSFALALGLALSILW